MIYWVCSLHSFTHDNLHLLSPLIFLSLYIYAPLYSPSLLPSYSHTAQPVPHTPPSCPQHHHHTTTTPPQQGIPTVERVVVASEGAEGGSQKGGPERYKLLAEGTDLRAVMGVQGVNGRWWCVYTMCVCVEECSRDYAVCGVHTNQYYSALLLCVVGCWWW